MKVIIVGAGVAGLAIGWRLAQSGTSIEIFDRGIPGRGATWAAAGMIAPGAELGHEPNELTPFARAARSAWPGFAAELEAESGRDIGYSEVGSLIVAGDETRAHMLQQHAALAASGDRTEWLTAVALQTREPLLSPKLHGALHVPNDAHVDNRSLGEALSMALARRNVRVRQNVTVRQPMLKEGKAHGVVTDEGVVLGDAVIVACGAWMNDLSGLGPEDLPPVKPAKGQMVAVQPPDGITLPCPLLWDENVYFVSRKNCAFVGATVEDAGFDTSVSREACARLIDAATRIIPSFSRWRVTEMWAGLRPRTPDDLPVLGSSGVPNLYVAGGQFRNGILFAPAVADVMCRLVLSGRPIAEVQAFDPRRFGAGVRA